MNRPITNMRRIDELVEAGLVDENDREVLERVAQRYAVSVPHTVGARIDAADPDDPLARQFVPSKDELVQQPGERNDPIGDELKSPVPAIVHRYRDRALLKLLNVCPVYCRFCFRREMVGPTANTRAKSGTVAQRAGVISDSEFEEALAYLQAHKEIWEVIVTGGDPLALSPRRLRQVNDALSRIEHIKIVRWHTRVPVVAPETITRDLCEALRCFGKTVYIGLHTNHSTEFSSEVRAACARLIDFGFPMVSQTVLLKGVNDDARTLMALMRTLVENRIKPYYLHHPDLAPGTGHFRVSVAKGQALMRELRAGLSGIAQPMYVLDIPGAHGKVPIHSSYIENCQSGDEAVDARYSADGRCDTYRVRDTNGDEHTYVDMCGAPASGSS